jgi:hypothetical protein
VGTTTEYNSPKPTPAHRKTGKVAPTFQGRSRAERRAAGRRTPVGTPLYQPRRGPGRPLMHPLAMGEPSGPVTDLARRERRRAAKAAARRENPRTTRAQLLADIRAESPEATRAWVGHLRRAKAKLTRDRAAA